MTLPRAAAALDNSMKRATQATDRTKATKRARNAAVGAVSSSGPRGAASFVCGANAALGSAYKAALGSAYKASAP